MAGQIVARRTRNGGIYTRNFLSVALTLDIPTMWGFTDKKEETKVVRYQKNSKPFQIRPLTKRQKTSILAKRLKKQHGLITFESV